MRRAKPTAAIAAGRAPLGKRRPRFSGKARRDHRILRGFYMQPRKAVKK